MDTLELAAHGPVIPVMVIREVADAVPTARALVAGGVRVVLRGGSHRDVGWVVNCTGPHQHVRDLRNPLLISDVSDHFRTSGFGLFEKIVGSGGVVRAIPAPGAAAQPRSFFDKLNDWARSEGAPGLGYVIFEEEGGALVGKGPIAKFIPSEVQTAIAAKAGVKAGDAVFFSAGEENAAAKLKEASDAIARLVR